MHMYSPPLSSVLPGGTVNSDLLSLVTTPLPRLVLLLYSHDIEGVGTPLNTQDRDRVNMEAGNTFTVDESSGVTIVAPSILYRRC